MAALSQSASWLCRPCRVDQLFSFQVSASLSQPEPLSSIAQPRATASLPGPVSTRCSARGWRVQAKASADEGVASSSNGAVEPAAEDMAAKLARVEAEAEALRRELAARQAAGGGGGTRGGRPVDLSKQKPATPQRKIDGTGTRETLFSAPGQGKSLETKKESKWGLSEADLFLSRGAGSGEFDALVGAAQDPGADGVVRRRILIGVGLAAATAALAVVRLPPSQLRPSKPLFFYLVPLLRVRAQLPKLQSLLEEGRIQDLREGLKQLTGSPNDLKDNLLNAARWLDTVDETDRATAVAFDVIEYVEQADYKKYFDNFGEPSPVQMMEFSKFSLNSLKAAATKLDEFLALMPSEQVLAAKDQASRTVF